MKPVAEIGFMPKALSIKQSPMNIIGHLVQTTKKFIQDGPIRQEIIRNGANWFING